MVEWWDCHSTKRKGSTSLNYRAVCMEEEREEFIKGSKLEIKTERSIIMGDMNVKVGGRRKWNDPEQL